MVLSSNRHIYLMQMTVFQRIPAEFIKGNTALSKNCYRPCNWVCFLQSLQTSLFSCGGIT